jgi:superfamily II DNA helicase RecQ
MPKKKSKRRTTKKGIIYFKRWRDAERIEKVLRKTHPEARIVEYGLGHAVQFKKSGDYYGKGKR